jgi:hypothetical protein
MEERVKEEIAHRATMGGLLCVANDNDFIHDDFCLAVFGRWNHDTKKLEIDLNISELICIRLIDALKKHKESEHLAAPVRRGLLLPKSFIATTAMQMLRTYSVNEEPPPVPLVELLSLLLDEGNYGVREHRAPYQKERATILVACDEGISNRELANAVGVSLSTISSWRNDPEFTGFAAALRENPKWMQYFEELYREDLPPTKKG